MSDRDDSSVKLPRAPRVGVFATRPSSEGSTPAVTREFLLDVDDGALEASEVPPLGIAKSTSLFGDLALGDDEIDDMFGSIGDVAHTDARPSLDAVALVQSEISSEAVRVVIAPPEADLESDISLEVDEDFEVFEDEAPELALVGVADELSDSDDADLTIDADGEEEFVEVEAIAEVDRGAALAASVTSRRRDEEDLDTAYVVDALAEVRARVDLLVGDAVRGDEVDDVSDRPHQQAILLGIGCQLASCGR